MVLLAAYGLTKQGHILPEVNWVSNLNNKNTDERKSICSVHSSFCDEKIASFIK